MPKKPTPKRRSSAPLTLAERVAAVDARVASEPAPFDKNDSVRDRLFALMMQRIDMLQEERADYLKIINALLGSPRDIRVVAPALQRSMKAMLQRAGAPHSPVHTTALGLAYVTIIAAWRNDTSADLGKTMKACDRALSLLENIAQMV